MTIKTLTELRDALNGAPLVQGFGISASDVLAYAQDHGLPTTLGDIDYPGLPTFGGEQPYNTTDVWSWDEENLLVTGDDVERFQICRRSEWSHKGVTSRETYKIEFVGFSPKMADTTGYYAYDYLADYDKQEFASVAEAQAWIEKNLKGPDCEGVIAKFEIV